MDYKGKRVWNEAPDVADNYRKAYVEGVSKFIQRLNENGKLSREEYIPPEKLVKNQEFYRGEYARMLGMDLFLEDTTSECTISLVGKDEICTIYRMVIPISKEIPFYAMLLIPHNIKAPMPLIIAQHGGWGTPELCCDMHGINNYNHLAQRAMERGAAILAPQLMIWSMEEKEYNRAHLVPFDRNLIDINLKRFGSSVTAMEISGIRKCLDYVCTMKEIDSEKIGMIGISYGGYFTLRTMALDKRIKAGYCIAVFNDRDVYPWSGWSYFGSALKFQDAEVAALCAPRRLYVQVGKQDDVFDYRSAVPEAKRAAEYYKSFESEENFKFSVWEGGHTVSDDDDGYDFLFQSFC